MSDEGRSKPTNDAQAARFVASELREYALGGLDVEHHDLHPVAGLIEDDQIRDLLVFQSQNYEPKEGMPADFWKTDYAQDMVERWASTAATKALDERNLTKMEYITGMISYESDVSGLKAIQQLEDWLLHSEAAKVVYLAGHMGNGKTDFAHLMAEVVMHRTRATAGEKEAEVTTNIPSSELPTIDHYDDLRDWFTEGSVEDNKWFIFDEASSVLSGYSHDRAKVEQLVSGLVKKMRKNGCNVVIIGHTGMDLHADLRRLSDYVQKSSLKTADFYASVKEGEGAGHLFRLDGIPETSLTFDTADEAPWDWGSAAEEAENEGLTERDVDARVKEERNIRIARLYAQTDIEQKKLAAAFGVSDRQIRRILNKVEVEEATA